MAEDSVIMAIVVMLGIHWVPLLIAAWRWPLRRFSWSIRSILTFGLCIFSWAVVLICLFIFTDVKNGSAGTGSASAWYIIYSVMTLGVVPGVILSAHVAAGRFAGFWWRRA